MSMFQALILAIIRCSVVYYRLFDDFFQSFVLFSELQEFSEFSPDSRDCVLYVYATEILAHYNLGQQTRLGKYTEEAGNSKQTREE